MSNPINFDRELVASYLELRSAYRVAGQPMPDSIREAVVDELGETTVATAEQFYDATVEAYAADMERRLIEGS